MTRADFSFGQAFSSHSGFSLKPHCAQNDPAPAPQHDLQVQACNTRSGGFRNTSAGYAYHGTGTKEPK